MSSTAAQIDANRRNAQLSTGPRTEAGRVAASRNALRTGLFATHQLVREDEAEGYEILRDTILEQLRPDSALEDCLAIEIINARFRLHRCNTAERAIAPLQNQANLPGVPAVHDFTNPAQTAINRARAAAKSSLKQDMADFKQLQSERWRRSELLTAGPIHPDELGMVPIREATVNVVSTEQRTRLQIRSGNLRLREEREMAALQESSPGLQNEPNPPATMAELTARFMAQNNIQPAAA